MYVWTQIRYDTNLLNNFMAPKIPWKAPLSSGTKWASQWATYLNIKIADSHNKQKWKHQHILSHKTEISFLINYANITAKKENNNSLFDYWGVSQTPVMRHMLSGELIPYHLRLEYQQFQSICCPPTLTTTANSNSNKKKCKKPRKHQQSHPLTCK